MAAKFVIGKNTRADEGSKQPSSRNSWNTLKPKPSRGQSFATSMTLTFALIAILMALIFVLVLAVVWGGQFSSYTRANMQAMADSTAESISEAYAVEGRWTSDVVQRASDASAFSSDIGVQVINTDGGVLYDDTWVAGGSSAKTRVDGEPQPQPSKSLAPTGADSVVTALVHDANGNKVGEVRLWAFGSDALLTKSDAAFKESSFEAIAIAASVSVLLACVIGYFASKRMSAPIQKITNTAKQIRNGDLTARSGVKGDNEVGQLGETFDDMATSLERDIKLEHRLTGDVAHELRTPLMAMQATVEAMQDGVLPADDEHFETVASEVRRLSRLVDAMLHLSRVENNEKFKTEKTDMVFVLKSLVTMQQQLFADCDLRLRFDDKTPNHELFADVNPDLIREAITNLMSNAMRYTPAGGWVVVSIGYEGRSYMQISVRDTGIGIAKEDIPRVFSRFWRSDASRERVSGGLGVGLALTKEIVDKHNGSISVESELGKGTTFTLHIPLEHKAGSPSREE